MLAEEVGDCLFIGDSSYDINCASAAGMDCVLVTWGAMPSDKDGGNKPTYVINNFQDIVEF
jgi:phosphoglycolate phosphatase-like HAD superfamily hydrolase